MGFAHIASVKKKNYMLRYNIVNNSFFVTSIQTL